MKNLSIWSVFVILTVLVFVPPVHSAKKETVTCIQSVATYMGYELGIVDGLFGRKTAEAIAAYTRDHRPRDMPKLEASTADVWCKHLRDKHEEEKVGGLTFHRMISESYAINAWHADVPNGMPVLIDGMKPSATVEHVVFYLHGDEMELPIFRNRCSRFSAQMPPGMAFVCIRRTTSFQSNTRRIRREVRLVVRTMMAIKSLWPDAQFHCVGHSGGGHNCLAAAQQPEMAFGCLSAASPVAAAKLRFRLWGVKNHRKLYEPIDYVSKTNAKKILIVGDPEKATPVKVGVQGDTVVDKRVWEAFVDAAEAKQLPIEYIKISEKLGHRTDFKGVEAVRTCINTGL